MFNKNNQKYHKKKKKNSAIINKCVLPLNPMDPKPVQMYIFNNIFFSFAIDTENKYEVIFN